MLISSRRLAQPLYPWYLTTAGQINVYSNIYTYLQIFEPRYKPIIPIFKSFTIYNLQSFTKVQTNYTYLQIMCPRAHVAKFYGRLQLIRSVWRASKFSVLKIDRNCNIEGLLHHPFWLQLILAPFGHYFSTFEITLFG